jgi:putative oxidoreductase
VYRLNRRIVSADYAGGRGRPSTRRAAIAVRWAAAIVFVVFGAGKFVDHGAELASFRKYGLPAPDAFVYLIGALEIGGGMLLASGRLVRLAALALAGDMVGAIIVSGLGRGEDVSLTLAPALLAAMIFLVIAGRGERAVVTAARVRHPPAGG